MAPPDEKQGELLVPMKCFILHATTALGTAVVRRFAREGPALILTDITSQRDPMAALAKEASMQGASRCMIYGGDIYSSAVEQEIIDSALSTVGDVDVLVIVPPEEGRSGARTARHSAAVRALLDALAPRMEAKGGGYILAVLREGRDGRLASDLEAVRQASERRDGKVNVVWSAFRDTRGLDAEATAEKLLNPLKAAAAMDGLDIELEALSTAQEEGGGENKRGDEAGWKLGQGGAAGSGLRRGRGVLVRRRVGDELCIATSETPGAVTTISDALLLEPDMGHIYEHDPDRDPALLVQCLEPFNGETPPSALVGSFLTETTTFFIRNHLPVPPRASFDDYRLRIEGMGMATTELSLHELQTSFRQVTVTATLQCAGNRRAEMAAHELVEGRTPWNAGAIGTAAWTGVLLRDVLDRCSNLPLLGEEGSAIEDLCAQFVILRGRDMHTKGRQRYESSLPIAKVLDARGDVLLAYLMNGEALSLDHGYPLRAVVPGYTGARWTKWLHSIVVSETDSQAPWTQEDYRLLPQSIKTHVQAKPLWRTAPPLLNMPITAAILVPEAGTAIQRGTLSIDVRGYAWSGGGHSVQRVDVSSDGGRSWVVAEWLHRPERRQAEGRTWAWALWQAKVPVPHHAQHRDVVELCVKALDRDGNTQPERVGSIWNFRGIYNNAWHRRLVYLE